VDPRRLKAVAQRVEDDDVMVPWPGWKNDDVFRASYLDLEIWRFSRICLTGGGMFDGFPPGQVTFE